MPFCHMMRWKPNGAWLILIAAMLWGTTGTTQALAPGGARPLEIGAVRLLVGGLGLLVLALATGKLVIHGLPLCPAIIGGVAVAVYQVTFFAGVDRTGVAVGTIVGIGSAPIMAGVLDHMVNQTDLSQRWYTSTGLAIVGCALLVASGDSVDVDSLGMILSLGAGLAYAVYTLASKALLRSLSPEGAMAVIFSIGAVLLFPLALFGKVSWVFTAGGLVVIVHLGILVTVVSYALFARGLMGVTASTAVTLSLAEPLTAGILGVIVVGERLSFSAVLGILLLLAGLYWLTVVPQERQA